jgi:hypothetical protein
MGGPVKTMKRAFSADPDGEQEKKRQQEQQAKEADKFKREFLQSLENPDMDATTRTELTELVNSGAKKDKLQAKFDEALAKAPGSVYAQRALIAEKVKILKDQPGQAQTLLTKGANQGKGLLTK